MDKDVRYFFVGLFALICLTSFAVFLSWLAGTHDSRSYRTYTVYFTDAVTGLTSGNDVRYKGVDAGTVIDIRLATDRPDLIKVDIQVSEQTPVRSGTVARLSMAGITGAAYIDLETRADDDTQPQHINTEPHPVIKGEGMQIASIMQDIPEISDNILGITEKIDALLSHSSLQALEHIPVRIDRLLERTETLLLSDNDESIHAVIKNVSSLTKDMNGLLSETNIANASKTLKYAASATQEFNKMTLKLERAATEIEKSARNLTGVIARNEDKLERLSKDGLNQIIRLSEESRTTAVAIKRLADKLEEDPSRLLYQPAYRGVHIKP